MLHVRQVLLRLPENQLFVKAKKCEFHISKVSFLGFIIPGKVRHGLAHFPHPQGTSTLLQ